MTREEAKHLVGHLASLPGLVIRCTNLHQAQALIATAAKEAGLSVSCISSSLPTEFYVVNKAHEAVAGIYSGRGLPAAEAARLGLSWNESDSSPSNQRISDESQSPDAPPFPRGINGAE